MLKFAIFLVKIWEYRIQVLLPLILLPVAVLGWAVAYKPLFEVTTIIGVDRDKASSPLLMNISDPNNALIMERRLKSASVVKDAIVDSGAVIGFESLPTEEKQRAVREVASHIKMAVLSDDKVRINYKSRDEKKAERILESLAGNFIDEVLAPERVRVGDLLASLGHQVQLYSEQEKQYLSELNKLQERLAQTSGTKSKEEMLKKVVAEEFNAQKAAAQKELAQEEYETLLMQSRALMGSEYYHEPNAIMWVVEPPISANAKKDAGYFASLFWLSLQAGVVLALILSFLRRFTDKSLKTDAEIDEALGLKILGHMPNFGAVESKAGRLIIGDVKNIFKRG